MLYKIILAIAPLAMANRPGECTVFPSDTIEPIAKGGEEEFFVDEFTEAASACGY